MQLFYSKEIESSGLCTLDEEESRHAVRVLRLREGDVLHVADGRGTVYACRVVDADARGCVVQAEKALAMRSAGPRLTLAVAPTKNPSRMEWLVEKAVEVGVSGVQLLLCERSERDTMKTDRLRRVALSAMKQSLHAELPTVEPQDGLDEWLRRSAEEHAGSQLLVAHCEADKPRLPLSSALEPGRDAVVLIGPEGDFTPGEIELAASCGYKAVSLGPSRLRTETAAIYAAVVFSSINDQTNVR